ncbi:MAG: hypothetical protein WBP94_10265 [Rhodomicrobiaceae bacterium]
MKAKIVACLILLPALSWTATAAFAAGSSAGYGGGGPSSRFDPIVSQYNQSGELFRIQGRCQSACTLFLGIRNVCIERSATLRFHAGHAMNTTKILPWATEHMLNAYNARLRSYVVSHHYMDTIAFHDVSGRDLIQKFGYRACPGR